MSTEDTSVPTSVKLEGTDVPDELILAVCDDCYQWVPADQLVSVHAGGLNRRYCASCQQAEAKARTRRSER